MRLEGWQILVVVALAIVLFGAPKLPGLARSVGQSLRIFKSEVKQLKDENNEPAPVADPVTGAVLDAPAPVPPAAGTVPPAATTPAGQSAARPL